MQMFDLLFVAVAIFWVIVAIKQLFFTPHHDKCYSRMEEDGIASLGSCFGAVGGDCNTNYLSYDCIDCPYFVDSVDGVKRGEKDE